ncbi:MAG: hypothetical protein HC828_11810 [Blastochloris sp.]|nr:hypothetical protein [Blastochloris sp.]
MENVRLDMIVRDSSLVTPALVIDHETISTTYARFIASFPGAAIDYAMKANANPEIVRHIVALGGGLEIASPAELQVALNAGASGDQIICSNPIKTPAFLQALQAADVYAVVVDSVYEVEKVARYAPAMRVYVRLAVDNTGAVLPLAASLASMARPRSNSSIWRATSA